MHDAHDIPRDRPRTPSVFISGSISIRDPLPHPVIERLDAIIDRKMPVLIGDADGVDAAVQAHLERHGTPNVTVFCGGAKPRRNIGGWPIRTVRADTGSRGRERHMAKDREMARLADTGFVIWNGTSPGSYANIERVSRRGCYVLVYLHREQRFVALRSEMDRHAFLAIRRPR